MNNNYLTIAEALRDTLFFQVDILEEDEGIITNNPQAQALDVIIAYEPETTSDARRLITACELVSTDLKRLANNMPCDCGLAGKVKELLRRDSVSRINRVQAQGKNDAYITIEGKRYPLEVKTNGGRIASLYKVKNPKGRFVLYELDYTIKAGKPRKDGPCKPAEHRQACKVMTVRAFLEMIEETKACKVIGHNASDRELAVQPDSNKLWKALQNFTDYDREKTFTWTDFTRFPPARKRSGSSATA